MKHIKLIGLLTLICFTFFYTEKIINVSIDQDEIMIELKKQNKDIEPINAIINGDTIIPGNIGKSINLNKSYKEMKKFGKYEEHLIKYDNIYPEISIYNNYNKYIIKGNTSNNYVSIIYIVNKNTIDNILKISKKAPINFFIDSNYLSNNINIINELFDQEIYNYGDNGIYKKDNIIYSNNIINNKSNNKSIYCLFTNKNIDSIEVCANLSMHSLLPTKINSYTDIKSNLSTGSMYLINNTQELPLIIDYINTKGYKIVPLSKLITE